MLTCLLMSVGSIQYGRAPIQTSCCIRDVPDNTLALLEVQPHFPQAAAVNVEDDDAVEDLFEEEDDIALGDGPEVEEAPTSDTSSEAGDDTLPGDASEGEVDVSPLESSVGLTIFCT
jgi:hypothetical protein